MPEPANWVVIDVETTGINPFEHQITAVALLPLDDRAAPKLVHIHHEQLNWTPVAKTYFRKYESQWRESALSPAAACQQIEEYLAQTFHGAAATPVGHNIGFDTAFLRQLAHLGGRQQLSGLSHRAIDTHTLLALLNLRGSIPAEALTSDGAFRQFGIEVPESLRHSALGDAQATQLLVRKLLAALN